MSDKRATRELERDLRRQPDNLPLRLRLAAAYRADGRTAEAVQLYRSVAVAYHGQRRLAQAIAVCRSVLELEPGQPETVALLAELEAMRPEGEANEPIVMPTGYTPALGTKALDDPETAAALAAVAPSQASAPHAMPQPASGQSGPIGAQTPRAGVRVLEQEVAVRELQPVRRSPVRPLMIPQAPPPVPPPLPRPSSAGLTPTPLPSPMPYHEAGDDSISEITVPPTTVRAPSRDTAPAPPPRGDWAAHAEDAATRIALPRALDDDAVTRIADDWKAQPPEPPTPPLAVRASSTQIDVTAELETRKRPRIDPHDLEVLGAASVTGAVPRVDDTHDDALPAEADDHAVDHADDHADDHVDDHVSGDTTHETAWPEEATDPREASHAGRAPSADTAEHPRTEEVGEVAEVDEVPTGVGDVAPSALFQHSFVDTLAQLAPDGQTVEGPGAGLLAVFTLLPDHARADLERTMIVRHPRPGEVIIREGDRGDSCFVIGQGEVRVLKSDPLGRAEGGGTGEAIEVARLGEGSLFGEFALLADRRRHATVEAVGACELYEIPRRALRELAAQYPEVGPALERFYRERLLATLLATAPFFQPLPEDQRVQLLARFVPLRAESGHTIVQEGERSGGLYLIVLGAVEIVKRGADGRNVLLATLREGAYVGEMSMLRGQAANASVIAAGPVELAFLPPRDFYEVVAGNPALWDAMRREASARALENAKILAGDTSAV